MVDRTALVLAGAGMLNDIAGSLANDGWTVVLPSRRYSPVDVEPGADPGGRVMWVEARWDDPGGLARRAARTMDGRRADLLVAWVHDSFRWSVLEAVAPLLTSTAAIVDVRSRTVTSVPEQPAPEPLPARRTQRVLLGEVSGLDERRPLGHGEIVAGVRLAMNEALEGANSAQYDVGRTRPRFHVPRPQVHGIAGVVPRQQPSPAAG